MFMRLHITAVLLLLLVLLRELLLLFSLAEGARHGCGQIDRIEEKKVCHGVYESY